MDIRKLIKECLRSIFYIILINIGFYKVFVLTYLLYEIGASIMINIILHFLFEVIMWGIHYVKNVS